MEKHIGYKIRQIRRLREYSQEYMSEQLGITKKKLFRIENGTSIVDPYLLSKIASFLKVDILCIKEFDANEFLSVYSRLCHLQKYLEMPSIKEMLKKIDLKKLQESN